jgi:hypothetical protein
LKKTCLILFIIFIFSSVLPAAGIVNGDFENGDLSGWTTSYGTALMSSALVVTPSAALYSNGGLNQVHSGNYAAQIYSGDGDSTHLDWASIQQDIVVPPGFTSLEMWFSAVVNGYHYINDPTHILLNEDAYVQFDVTTPSSTVFSQKFGYYQNITLLVDGIINPPNDYWKYLPWMQVVVPLADYVGQTLTIKYTAYDCNQGGHFCYGYIDDLRFIQPPSPTPSITPTGTITLTPTFSATITLTGTPTDTPTLTPSVTQSFTPSITPTYTITRSATVTPTFTITPTYTETPVPLTFMDVGPFPNPFKVDTQIVYWISTDANVTVKIFTVSGEVVAESDPADKQAGYNKFYWDGLNKSRKRVASEVYIYRIFVVSPRKETTVHLGKVACVR